MTIATVRAGGAKASARVGMILQGMRDDVAMRMTELKAS